jgi:hypothetical protein
MTMIYRSILFAVSALALHTISASAAGHIASVEVANRLPQPRSEIVEIEASLIPAASFIVRDTYGAEVPWQLTHDGKIIFQASVAPNGRSVYTIEEGKPASADVVAYAAFYPERVDDLAWENDFAAYRAYGPASGGGVSGYDVFTKSTTRPVVPERYFKELVQKVSYHIDHGDGMDQYDVGPTLGGGASAVIDRKGELVLPGAFSQWKILDNGPLRTTIELTYEYAGGKDVRVISLDAGTPFNRTRVTTAGIAADSIAAGIVVHSPADKDYVTAPGYVAYSDPTTGRGYGHIYIGVLTADKNRTYYRPLPERKGAATGHALLTAPTKPGKQFEYYWGSSWSKGRTLTFGSWVNSVEDMQRRLNSPLEVKVK